MNGGQERRPCRLEHCSTAGTTCCCPPFAHAWCNTEDGKCSQPGGRGAVAPATVPGPGTRVGQSYQVVGLGSRRLEISSSMYQGYQPPPFGGAPLGGPPTFGGAPAAFPPHLPPAGDERFAGKHHKDPVLAVTR